MSVKTYTAFEVVCDADPDCRWWDDTDPGITPVFRSEARAWDQSSGTWLEEWRIDGDRHVCPRHANLADCAAFGHDWEPWADCRCEGRIPDHAEADCPQVRHCQRQHCWEPDERPAVLA